MTGNAILSLSAEELDEVQTLVQGVIGQSVEKPRHVVLNSLTVKARAARHPDSITDMGLTLDGFRKEIGKTLAQGAYWSVMRCQARVKLSESIASLLPLRYRNGLLYVIFPDQSDLCWSLEDGFSEGVPGAINFRKTLPCRTWE